MHVASQKMKFVHLSDNICRPFSIYRRDLVGRDLLGDGAGGAGAGVAFFFLLVFGGLVSSSSKSSSEPASLKKLGTFKRGQI